MKTKINSTKSYLLTVTILLVIFSITKKLTHFLEIFLLNLKKKPLALNKWLLIKSHRQY